MQKVYLLLRSNKQTGPYSLEELLQLNLKPFDLVWVDGRSAAWQYPSEIPSLKAYVPETPQAAAPFQPIATSVMEEMLVHAPNSNAGSQPQNPISQKTETQKRVFISIPKTYTPPKEQKTFANQNSYAEHEAYMPHAEEPRAGNKIEVKQAIPTYAKAPSSYQQKAVGDEDVQTNYSRSVNDVEEDYTKWMYQKKTKKKVSVNPKDLALVVLILAVIGGGYYVMSKPSLTNSVMPANTEIAAQTIQQPGENISNNADETQPKQILTAEQKVIPGSNEISNPANANGVKPITNRPKSKTIQRRNHAAVSKAQTGSSVPSSQISMPVEKTNSNISNNDQAVSKEPQAQQSKENVPEKKKEKFGDLIKSIFSKKDRKDETQTNKTVSDDPKPANNRQATRRDESDNSSENSQSKNEAGTTDLTEQIDLTSNSPANWMMGVRNLKITLRNRSNVTIQTASVLVNYYNENNDLLEKKLVYFNNIAPKSRLTVAAPDSKFADHVDFKLTSASAKQDSYAKN